MKREKKEPIRRACDWQARIGECMREQGEGRRRKREEEEKGAHPLALSTESFEESRQTLKAAVTLSSCHSISAIVLDHFPFPSMCFSSPSCARMNRRITRCSSLLHPPQLCFLLVGDISAASQSQIGCHDQNKANCFSFSREWSY